jgi:hypothetical protein
LVRAVLIGAVVALVAAIAGTITLNDRAEAPEPTPPPTTAPLAGAAAELATLLETRQGQEYHARYEGEAGESSSVVIETWQDGAGQVRQDQILRTGDTGAHLVSIVSADGEVRCTQIATDEWNCRRAPAGDLSRNDPVAAVRTQLAGGEVTASNVDVDGAPARCFELVTAGSTSELCARPDTGIPVRIAGGTTELRLVQFDDTVDPTAFEPPAAVTG